MACGRFRRAWPAVALAALAAAPAAGEDPLLDESRALAAEFGDRLRTALQAAMADGGPVAAIEVCKELAPGIASELSRLSGAQVGRTSLRVRNPRNLAADWQRPVLRDFESGQGSREFFERLAGGEARYMKAIPTGALCTTCHGVAIPLELRSVLTESYPHDRATGYEAGDIRGAFTIVWPVERAAED